MTFATHGPWVMPDCAAVRAALQHDAPVFQALPIWQGVDGRFWQRFQIRFAHGSGRLLHDCDRPVAQIAIAGDEANFSTRDLRRPTFTAQLPDQFIDMVHPGDMRL